MPPSNIESLGWLLTTVILAALVLVAVFLIIRQLVLWYWRVNEMADNLAYIANYYRRLDQPTQAQREQEAHQRIAALGRATQSLTHPSP